MRLLVPLYIIITHSLSLSSSTSLSIREMYRVTMCQSFVHQISSASSQKRTGVFSIDYYLASRTLLWAGHLARMPKSRLPERLMPSWVHEPRIAGGQEMTYGRSAVKRSPFRNGQPWRRTALAGLNSLRKRLSTPPRCDTRVTPEEKRRFLARRAQETEQRHALFNAETDAETTEVRFQNYLRQAPKGRN